MAKKTKTSKQAKPAKPAGAKSASRTSRSQVSAPPARAAAGRKSTAKKSGKPDASPRKTAAKESTSDKSTRTAPKSRTRANEQMSGVAPASVTANGDKNKAKPASRDGKLERHNLRRSEERVAPLPKTRLSAEQLRSFKELLLAKRSELLSDVRMLTKDALGKSRKDSAGDLSSMPIHMADIGSDNWEQDFTLGLIANERQLVREIDEALQRIEDGTYGVCLATRKPITVARLRAKPWAKYCIEYAQQMERRGR